MASSLYFSFANQYSLGWGFPFPIVLVPRYKLSLCHTPIKPDLLGFSGICVFACGLRDHVITRFASLSILVTLGKNKPINAAIGAGHITHLIHMNWALLGIGLDELKVVLLAS